MRLENLIKKLTRLKINFVFNEGNGYNKSIDFTFNGKTYEASYTQGKNIIEYYCRAIGYCQSSQETQRIFYYSLNKIINR